MNGSTNRPAIWAWCVVVTALSLSPFAASAQQAQPTHPLDALTGAELHQVKAILQAEGKLGPKARFHNVDLDEPEKAVVTAWRPGASLPRRAIAVVSEAGTVHQAAIDLTAGRMTAWQAVTGEPALLLGEMIGAADMALADSRMVQALAKRGVTPGQVFCLPLTPGNFGRKEEQGQRLLKVPCYAKPADSNVWARPIEGLFATVDLKTGKAIDVTDTGMVPVSAEPWGYDEVEVAKRGALRPETKAASLSQPGGDNITIEEGRFVWDMWRFHLRADKRPGTVLSMVEARDGARWRSVAYQMHLSEIFVPYMDPDQSWYWRAYMDSGEYGFGNFLSPLRRGVDCPPYARFLTVTMPQDDGEPIQIPNAICMFERSIGDPAWRHYETVGRSPQNQTPTAGRPASELVVRSAAAIGNYDYLVDYVFHQDGSIRIAVGATGVDATKGVTSQSMKDATAAADTRHGTLIAAGLVAPFHSHYFNFRLDLDIDGTANDFMRERLTQQAAAGRLAPAFALCGRIRDACHREGGPQQHRAGLACALSFRQSQCRKRARSSPRLHADAGRQLRASAARGRRSAGPAQFLSALSALGDALCVSRALCRRALRHDERWVGHARRLDRAGPADRQSRHRRLVHGRLPPHHADGRLACHADALVRLHADAAQFLCDESGDDYPGCEVGAAVSLGAVRRSTSAVGGRTDMPFKRADFSV